MLRTVVITGVSRGLGHALASGFAERGHTVVGCGRSAAAVVALRSELPEPHEIAELDVRSAAVAEWAARVVERHGAPDLVLNNAAVINSPAPLWTIDEEEFAAVLDTNVGGSFRVLKAFLPAMIERGQGVVVNFSSGWGRSTSPGVAPYCASKFAIEGMTRALARELPEGLAAVAVNPGVIDTGMLRSAWGDVAAAYPTPRVWANKAVPFLLALGPADSGRSLDVPAAE